MFTGIDFYSDTVTRPTQKMRQAIAEAEVGDEQKGEDPTTLKLEERAAKLLGHSAALFFPSATMANEVAIRLHCQPGDEVIASGESHVFGAEVGGPAVHAQVITRPIYNDTGIFCGQDVRALFRHSTGPHYPRTRLVVVENTSNLPGGIAWQKPELDSVQSASKDLGLKTHLDGARLMNAAVATHMSPSAIAGPFDSVTLCLSKGLGCPAGAILAFDKTQFSTVRRLKQLFGGALRQSGILAAAGLYALDHHVERLSVDHENARILAEGLKGLKGISVEQKPHSTNMVFFHWKGKITSDEWHQEVMKHHIRFSFAGQDRLRAVLHLDISQEAVYSALKVLTTLSDIYG